MKPGTHRLLIPPDRARLATIRQQLNAIGQQLGIFARRMDGEIAEDLRLAANHVGSASGCIKVAMEPSS